MTREAPGPLVSMAATALKASSRLNRMPLEPSVELCPKASGVLLYNHYCLINNFPIIPFHAEFLHSYLMLYCELLYKDRLEDSYKLKGT